MHGATAKTRWSGNSVSLIFNTFIFVYIVCLYALKPLNNDIDFLINALLATYSVYRAFLLKMACHLNLTDVVVCDFATINSSLFMCNSSLTHNLDIYTILLFKKQYVTEKKTMLATDSVLYNMYPNNGLRIGILHKHFDIFVQVDTM